MQVTTSNSKINQTSIENWLVEQLSQVLSLDANTIEVTEPLTRYGLDSIDAVTLVGDLEDWLDLELPDTLFWDHPNIAQASQFLIDNYDISGEIEGSDSVSDTQASAEKLETVSASNGKKSSGGLWAKLTGA